jgi:hypothetical protein
MAVNAVESGGADRNHDQRLVACRLEPVERAMRQQHAFVLADRAGLAVRPVEGRLALEHDKGVVLVRGAWSPFSPSAA